MRWVLAFLILISNSVVFATNRCAAVFQFDSATPSPQVWQRASNKAFYDSMVGDHGKDNELYFYWHTAYPTELKPMDNLRYRAVPAKNRMRIYHNRNDLKHREDFKTEEEFNAQNPLDIINTFLARQDTSNETMLKGFIGNYKGRVSDQIVAAVKALEDLLASTANERQSFGYVATGPAEAGGRILGTFRIFNGVPSHSNTSPLLPMEVSFRTDKVRPKIAERLEEMRRKDPNALIFELGKFSVHAEGPVAERVRTMLELFWLRYYVDSLPPDALFYAHTVSKAHVRLYQRNYGLRVIEEVAVPGQAETEYVMEATGKELRAAFERLHGLPKRGIEILHP